jgi:hypothetical protein
MKTYKTSKRIRERALAYYYANREQVRRDQQTRRRARGVPEAKPAMTDVEKLKVVRICRCGRQVTTPSLLRHCSNVCLRCRKQTPAGKASTARANRHHKDSPTHARAWVRAEKLKRGCSACGARPKAARLHFHHRDPATKLFKVAWGVYHVSAKILRAEIAKCDVLCAECNKEKHG